VIEAIRAIDATDVSFYPEYDHLMDRAAAHFGTTPDRLILTNGLDEGILAAAVAYLGPRADRGVAEAVIVEPAFEMYMVASGAVGARLVHIQPDAGFDFPLDAVMQALTSRTGVVFVASPNNPTGQLAPREAVLSIAAAIAPGAIVFVDEAYADFCEESMLDVALARPNIVIGRTFAKAYGLAALRIGAVLGHPETLAPMRRVVPPYSLNVAAVKGLEAALTDVAHVRSYVAEAEQSKQLLYETFDRLGLRYWPSAGNFVLVSIGDDLARVVRELQRRGIAVRDRSHQPGCAGCVRITAGVLEHTRACVDALQEVLCGAR
jgi:histidinol-phosphate aminotransferase